MKFALLSKVVLIGAFVMFAFGCSGSTADKIVGKWQPAEKGESIEYLKDGTVVVVTNGKSLKGKWSLLEGDTVKFETAEGGNATVYKYKVSFYGDDEMSTVGESNQVYKFTRVKP